LKQVRICSKHDKTHQGFIKCTKWFVDFTQTEICDNLVVAAVYYVSSSLWLTHIPDLGADVAAEQTRIQVQSKQIISSLYCQILLSPMSQNFRVRQERIFYETLIFFLDVCACYSIRYEPPDEVYDLIAAIFRRGIPDPNSRRPSEFLPITEIVRRNWLSQRVPGKNRSEIPHATLQGNTELINAVVLKDAHGDRAAAAAAASGEELWDERGFPPDTPIPYAEKVLNRDNLFVMPQPKHPDSGIPGLSTVASTTEGTPRDK
jgi:hypothetical protein